MFSRPPDSKSQISDGVWKNNQIRYRIDRLVVKLSPIAANLGPDPNAVLQEILKVIPGATCLRGPGRTGRVVIGVPTGTDVLSVASQLNSRKDIEYAEPDIVDTGVDENQPDRGM